MFIGNISRLLAFRTLRANAFHVPRKVTIPLAIVRNAISIVL
ncbi:hypothetical protein OKW43_004948 [Paraburkholderia sp. WC7.3g]